jgi:hypothetical protein
LQAVAACLNAGDLMLMEFGAAGDKPAWPQMVLCPARAAQ